ncbi:MAG: ribosome biogenesis GTPase Der [Verrucomicrobiales bacterium]|nr:ribosome biogenesis GTPase Der [Verrucomicrobiales bacterium]
MPRTVAIVGRPNVGKSALFNRLAGKNISIVHDMAGVTRDRITAECRRAKVPFVLMDTGGIGANTDDVLTEQVQTEAALALEVADLLLFVVDVTAGITPIDQELAAMLRRTQKSVILVCNKADSAKRRLGGAEFTRMGFPEQVEVSALHGLGIDGLVSRISTLLDLENAAEEEEETERRLSKKPLKLAIVGRPNAGKSSLVNAILGQDRAIVSDVAGTTRDSLDILASFGGADYQLIDTAGIRRNARIDTPVEIFSIRQAHQSIKRADLVLLVIDCASGATMQDRKIAQEILKEQKPCLLVMNKFDLYHPDASRKDRLAELDETMRREFFFLHYAPLIAISAKQKQHLGKLFEAVQKIRGGARHRIGTGQLNRLLHQAIENSPGPLGRSTRSFKLLYASQVNSAEDSPIPVPHFVLFANRAEKLVDSYLRYLENVIRQEWPAPGVPFRISVRGKPSRQQFQADRKEGWHGRRRSR